MPAVHPKQWLPVLTRSAVSVSSVSMSQMLVAARLLPVWSGIARAWLKSQSYRLPSCETETRERHMAESTVPGLKASTSS